MARGGPLSDPAIVKSLQPFVVTTWNGDGEANMPAEIMELFLKSEVGNDPKRLNVSLLMLDQDGHLVHSFHGLPSGRRAAGEGRSDYSKEIPKALTKLNLPLNPPRVEKPLVLPDLKRVDGDVPGGLRMFIQSPSKMPVVELLPMKAEEWVDLEFSDKPKDLEAKTLKRCLEQIYPPAIRSVDANQPFTKFIGKLRLEPAGADKDTRYALLRGEVQMEKAAGGGSSFEGNLEAVLTYDVSSSKVKSVRAVIEGDYLYRQRDLQRMPMRAAIESRPN